jgi:hypothetical protein|tara:strand:- start:1190 stop:1663 length:474 start_codon:yes stop_codon:yes gene_type:complete
VAEGFSDATEGGAVSGLLGEIEDLDGILDLPMVTDFITTIPGSTDSTAMGGENPHQYQVGLDKLGNFAKTALTYGATAGLYGINPLLAVAAHTPGSFFRAGAKKLGGGDLDKWDKADLATGLISPTPLSSFVNKFVDIVFPGSTTLDDPDKNWKLTP